MPEYKEPAEGRLFTPDIKAGSTYPGETMQDGRALMSLSLEDATAWHKARESNEVAIITDQNTGTRWAVRRAACGLGCMCAAEAEAVVPAPKAAADV